ncbi:MAG: dephospho-CoA kinase, partial [Cellulosimicrobium funkei]
MFRIGLTGGIAAGKSVALARFAELGAVVVD